MSWWRGLRQTQPSSNTSPDPPEEGEALTPPPVDIQAERGSEFCSARACIEETGFACAYRDRRDRRCPTAWCPEHRRVVAGAVYCPRHGRHVDGTHSEFGSSNQPDLGNPAPALATWVAREMDDDIRAMMEAISSEYRQVLVVDPVRFVLVGVGRVRTWERAWKVCAHIGVSLRVAIAIEESQPQVVHGRVNSRSVVELSVPPAEELDALEPPQAAAAFRDLHATLFLSIARAVDRWRSAEPPAADPVG